VLFAPLNAKNDARPSLPGLEEDVAVVCSLVTVLQRLEIPVGALIVFNLVTGRVSAATLGSR
jgi:hypothetical protein